jgi:hypothetical protein
MEEEIIDTNITLFPLLLKLTALLFVVVANVDVSNNFVINMNYSKMQSTVIVMLSIL